MTNEKRRPSILIVDDLPGNIQVLAETLRADYRIRVATNGAAALDVVGGEKPDLILLDVMMAGMDGYEVCRRLKENPASRDVPVIFVTARDDAADEEYGLRLGAMDYIVKPFHPAIVKARVRNHIDLKMRTDLLESLALIDGLTGIGNRRRFDEALVVEWKRAARLGTPLALVIADVDHFKFYNDSYGHCGGDECLKAVAWALASALGRPADMLARYGGEEFVALMPDTDAAGAQLLAQRWCDKVAALALPHDRSPTAPHVTVSVGYAAQMPAAGQTPQTLVESADALLYQAKQRGRNRACGGE